MALLAKFLPLTIVPLDGRNPTVREGDSRSEEIGVELLTVSRCAGPVGAMSLYVIQDKLNGSNIVNLLNEIEARVVGSLMEKQMTTPEYYPLTLNALLHACNQISNRDPVVSFDEKTVALALESLREKNLAYVFYGADSRVPKYKHVMPEIFHLSQPEMAVMCVLMLRGPQTIGELRGRTGRMYEFTDLAEVEATLEKLSTREDEPLVARLPRQPGKKDSRYSHLLAGEVAVDEQPARTPRVEPVVLEVRAENEKVSHLESEVQKLRQEVRDLRQQFDQFKKQFE